MKYFLLFTILFFSQLMYCQKYYLAEDISDHGIPSPKELILHAKSSEKIISQFHKSSLTYSSWTHFFQGDYIYFLGRIDSNSENCVEYRFEKFSTKNLKDILYTEHKICDNSKNKWTYLIINESLIVLKNGVEISSLKVEKLNKENIWLD